MHVGNYTRRKPLPFRRNYRGDGDTVPGRLAQETNEVVENEGVEDAMKLSFLAAPLLLLALSGQGTHSFAQEATSKPRATAGTIHKRVLLKYILPSDFVRQINDLRQAKTEGIKNDAKLTPKDSDNSLLVQGTSEAVAEMEQLIRFLDVNPRITKIALRLIQVQLAEDGTEKETLLQSPSLEIKNNLKAQVQIDSAAQSTKIAITPHINGDGSVSLGATLGISLATDTEAKSAEATNYRRLTKRNEWNVIQTITLANDPEVSASVRPGSKALPAAYPLYRLEASVTEVK